MWCGDDRGDEIEEAVARFCLQGVTLTSATLA
jgi:hypothetical protein